MFEKVPNTRVMSEPYPFSFVWDAYLNGRVSHVEYKKLLDSTFRIQCKKEKDIEHIIIKLNMSATPVLTYLKRAYPKIQLLFNTRHPLPSLKSYGKLWNFLPVSGTIKLLLNVEGLLWDKYPIHVDDVVWWERYRKLKKEGCTFDQQIALRRFFFFNYWCVMEQYTKNKELYEKVILFEDLCDRPAEVLEDIFSAIDISSVHIPAALDALKKDSQNGFFGKRGTYRKEDVSTVIDSLDKQFKDLGIPISMTMSFEDFRKVLK